MPRFVGLPQATSNAIWEFAFFKLEVYDQMYLTITDWHTILQCANAGDKDYFPVAPMRKVLYRLSKRG